MIMIVVFEYYEVIMVIWEWLNLINFEGFFGRFYYLIVFDYNIILKDWFWIFYIYIIFINYIIKY